MILKTEKFQEACKKILEAVDTNNIATDTDTLELRTEGNVLFMDVTNREYFVELRIQLDSPVELRAAVDANLFLNLISKITTKDIELFTEGQTLFVKGNGTYKIPLVFEGDKLKELPRITIDNVVKHFSIPNTSLQSIFDYNIKELQKGAIVRPVQRLFYVDEFGAITFTSGACVNHFTLPESVKMLLNERIVRLFRLLDSSTIDFELGMDQISETLYQTKVMFRDDNVTITAIISSDSSLMQSVPVQAIRGFADKSYPYTVSLNKDALLEALTRMLLFTRKSEIALYVTLEFESDGVTVYDAQKENKEKILYEQYVDSLVEPYTLLLEINDLKLTLETCKEKIINVHFGDNQSAVITRGTVANVIPECHYTK